MDKEWVHVSGSQKPCSSRTTHESSLPRKEKIISNVTSEERTNIWEMKPKWNLLAYILQNKAANFFFSSSQSLIDSLLCASTHSTHTQLYRKEISHASWDRRSIQTRASTLFTVIIAWKQTEGCIQKLHHSNSCYGQKKTTNHSLR